MFINVSTANLNENSNWILDKDNKIVKEKSEITKINIVKKYLFMSFVSKLILEKTNLKICTILKKQLKSAKTKILKKSQEKTLKDLTSSLQPIIDDKSKIKYLD